MFLRPLGAPGPPRRFPRIRGDVPPLGRCLGICRMFSPHTRGCSYVNCDGLYELKVFPAYAGMFRGSVRRGHSSMRFPRIRGDVPAILRAAVMLIRFSPHTRGCSYLSPVKLVVRFVFPAYAGMFLPSVQTISGVQTFSPHTRGCSFCFLARYLAITVFPAYAGMFRRCMFCRPRSRGFPRIRGDVPIIGRRSGAASEFSPHTRGCSYSEDYTDATVEVFPAYAGMFPPSSTSCKRYSRFPRIRGDVPNRLPLHPMCLSFSPHTRGCSVEPQPAVLLLPVFPAYAGMFHACKAAKDHWEGFPRIRGDVP